MKEYVVKYSFEFVVIFLGILISLYFEDARQDRVENERKNKSIEQLINVIDQDINQINNFIKLQEVSLESSDILYDNLNNEINLSEEKIMYHISSVGRALKSFFPQEGIFNQLISSDFNYKLSVNFFLEHNWKTDVSEVDQIVILKYRFNNKFYESDEFFGNLIESRKNIKAYLNELNELKLKYSDLKSLCLDEIRT